VAGGGFAFLGLGVAEQVSDHGKNSDYNDDSACGGVDTGRRHDLASSADTAQVVSLVRCGAATVATGLAVTSGLTVEPTAEGQTSGLSFTCSSALAGVSCLGRFGGPETVTSRWRRTS
jgi:hypothetical protein